MPEILVVDDDQGVRELLTELATLSHYDIRCASSGEEFFRLYSEQQPDLLIIDLVLPNMDGVEMIRRLSSLNCTQPLLVISGYDFISSEGLELLSQGLNFKGFIKKPFNVRELHKIITSLIEPASTL